MNWNECEAVEVVPGKVFGVPVLRQSRVQADTVLESFELGQSAEQIADSFELNIADVRKVVSFAASRSALKTFA